MVASFLPKMFPSGNPLVAPDLRGLLRANTALSNLVATHSSAVSVSAASTTYTNLTGGTLSITKQFDNSYTDLLVMVALSARVDTASRTLTVGVTDGSTTLDLAALFFNTAGEHLFMLGGGIFTGRNNSTVSFQFQMKNSGTGTFTMDGNDEFSAVAWEVTK